MAKGLPADPEPNEWLREIQKVCGQVWTQDAIGGVDPDETEADRAALRDLRRHNAAPTGSTDA